MQVMARRVVNPPHITLFSAPAPRMFVVFRPPIQDQVMLTLIIRIAPSQRVLRPNDVGRPMPTGLTERCAQAVKPTRSNADVNCSLTYSNRAQHADRKKRSEE